MSGRPRTVDVRAGRLLAGRIPGARYVELPGEDHLPFCDDADAILDEVEEFLTGVRRGPEPDRVLATVMFMDVVDSTHRRQAGRCRRAHRRSHHRAGRGRRGVGAS